VLDAWACAAIGFTAAALLQREAAMTDRDDAPREHPSLRQ
jgi:hypothetical protein